LAITEAQRAIEEINAGKANVSLRPVNSDLRRQQHQMARQANIVSHSYGKEPFRYVRMFSTKRN
jgi:predicted RNA-binding protein Jag